MCRGDVPGLTSPPPCPSSHACGPQEKGELTEQSLSLFRKRDELDELEGFQQQELAKVKHMVRLIRVGPLPAILG